MPRGQAVRRGVGGRGIVALLALAFALTGCLLETTPRTPAPPTPTPTPRPPPTPTPTPLRIAYPTAPPSPTPTATPIAELRGAGQLLYIGKLEGRQGIVVVEADGSGRRLLVEGEYRALAWSPDGRRFAAVNWPRLATSRAEGPSTVEVFTAEGERLRRVQLDGIASAADWAPDGRRLAVNVRVAPEAGGAEPVSRIWLLDPAGPAEPQELTLGWQTLAGPWSPSGQLAAVVLRDADGDGRAEVEASQLWLVEATGEARKLSDEALWPLGWSSDGGTLYGLGDFRTERDAQGRTSEWPTSVLVLDARTGERRTLATLEGLAAQLQGANDPAPRYRIGWGALAPVGERLALWLWSEAGGTTPSWELRTTIAVLDGRGHLLWQDSGLPQLFGGPLAWSPDGARLAYIATAASGRVGAERTADARVIDFAAPSPEIGSVPVPDVTGHRDFRLQWSPNGRWFAVSQQDPGALTIVAVPAPLRAWGLANDATSATWRPRR